MRISDWSSDVCSSDLAAMTTDLSTYIPFAGPIKRLGFAGRTLKGLLLGTTAAAIPEVGLHQFQELRTLEESFLNIGTAGVLVDRIQRLVPTFDGEIGRAHV